MRTLTRIERRENKGHPDLRDLINIAYALDVPWTELIEDEWLEWTAFDDFVAPPAPRDGWQQGTARYEDSVRQRASELGLRGSLSLEPR